MRGGGEGVVLAVAVAPLSGSYRKPQDSVLLGMRLIGAGGREIILYLTLLI